MAERLGPVELYLVGFTGERPDPSVVEALVAQAEAGLVRLLDFLVIAKSASGEVAVRSIDPRAEYGLDVEIGPCALCLAKQEDIDDFAELIDPGASAVLVAMELVYTRELSARLEASETVVLAADRIPSGVVNSVFAAAARGEL